MSRYSEHGLGQMRAAAFGFHCGPQGNHEGIGEHWEKIAAAGKPLVVMSADHYGFCQEAIQRANAQNVGVTAVFRLTTAGQNDGFNYDVPGHNYTQPEQEAALEYWEATVRKLPQEFDKRTYILCWNEIDHERLAYCARVANHICDLALPQGYRVAFFGINSGEPEPEDWRNPDVIRFLRRAASDPDHIAIALHEYSFSADGAQVGFPHLWGREMLLFDTCQEYGISFGNINLMITEAGQGKDASTHSSADFAVSQYPWIQGILPQNVSLIAWWWLAGSRSGGDSWQGLCNIVQQMIAPTADYIVANDVPPAPIDPPPEECRGEPRVQYQRTTILLPQGYGLDWYEAAARGAWPARWSIGYSADDAGIGDLDSRTVIVVNADEWE